MAKYGLRISTTPPNTSGGNLVVGQQFTTLNVDAIGLGSYSATLYPLQGQVPAGSTVSKADGIPCATILSTWNDGSAAVVIVSGTTNSSGNIPLYVATGNTGTATSIVAITQLITSLAFDFGAYGVAAANVSSPAFIWWNTPQTICARYLIDAPTPGTTVLQAVIDVQVWPATGEAIVEAVLENGKLNIASPVKPGNATYTNATLIVNGIASSQTISSSGGPEGFHTPFRAAYLRTVIGSGGVNWAYQNPNDLQKHPLLFKIVSSPQPFTPGADTYTPWYTGRHRATGMGGGGDHPSIGPLPAWETRFLRGDGPLAAQAVIANTLAILGWNVQYRNALTGLVPTATQLVGKNMQSGASWPSQSNGSEAMTWEVAHHPAAGLMAFAAKPSPIFIEIAQKITVWNGTWSTGSGNVAGWIGWTGDATGVFGYWYQLRGIAWAMRSLAHATFLTPTSVSTAVTAWKDGGKIWLDRNKTYLQKYRTKLGNNLAVMYDAAPDDISTGYSNGVVNSNSQAMWMMNYLQVEMGKIASANLLSGTAQSEFIALTDWMLTQPVRWINEQSDGGWRFIPYATPINKPFTPPTETKDTFKQEATWGQQMDWWHTDSPPVVTGSWMSTGSQTINTYAAYGADNSAGAYYPSYLWSALVMAVERNIPNSAEAWNTVQAGITNLTTWLNGFITDPRWGATPKNPPVAVSAPAWVNTLSSNVWTELPNTNYSTWAAANIGSGYKGSDPKNAPVNAYCVQTIDPVTKKVYIWGGGHNDGSYNAFVSFDFWALTYTQVGNPTPVSAYPPSFTRPDSTIVYPSGFTSGFFETAPPLTNPADLPYAAPARAKQASHVYASSIKNGTWTNYYGPIGDANITTGAWTYLNTNPYGPQLFAINPSYQSTHIGSSCQCATDSVTGKDWIMLTPGDEGINFRQGTIIRVEPSTHTIEAVYNLSGAGGVYTTLISGFAIHGRHCYVFYPLEGYPGPYTYTKAARVNLDTGLIEYFSISGTPPTGGGAFFEKTPFFSTGTNLYGWNFSSDRNALHKIDLTITGGTGTPANPYQISCSRIQLGTSTMPQPYFAMQLNYIKEWGVLVRLPNANSNWWALKIT